MRLAVFVIVICLGFPLLGGCLGPDKGPLVPHVFNVEVVKPELVRVTFGLHNTGSVNLTRIDADFIGDRRASNGSLIRGGSSHDGLDARFEGIRDLLNDTDVIPPGGWWNKTLTVEYDGPGKPVDSSQYYWFVIGARYRSETGDGWVLHYKSPCFDSNGTAHQTVGGERCERGTEYSKHGIAEY